jgi:hypothetical protein
LPPPVLPPPGTLPAALVLPAHRLWRQVESAYIDGLSVTFASLRAARRLALEQLTGTCRGFYAFLARPDGRQALLAAFVERFNAVEHGVRDTKEAQVRLPTPLVCHGTAPAQPAGFSASWSGGTHQCTRGLHGVRK